MAKKLLLNAEIVLPNIMIIEEKLTSKEGHKKLEMESNLSQKSCL